VRSTIPECVVQPAAASPKLRANEAEAVVIKAARSARSTAWVARGGEAATGCGWLTRSPWGEQISCNARTETETWCAAEKCEVYRCLLLREADH
jgi:hypothetical protein